MQSYHTEPESIGPLLYIDRSESGIPTYRTLFLRPVLVTMLDDFHLARVGLAMSRLPGVYSVSRSSLRCISITIVRVTLRCEPIVVVISALKMVHPDLSTMGIPIIIRSRMRRCGPVRRPRAGGVVCRDSVGHILRRMRVRA